MPENTTEESPPQLDNVRDNATQEDFKMKIKCGKCWNMQDHNLKNFPEQKRACTEDRRNHAGYFGIGHNA